MTDDPINPRDDFEDMFPDDRSTDGYADWLDQLAKADDEDRLFEILAGQRPPSSKLARQQIRGRLKLVLEERLSTFESGASPARTADAWLQEGGELGDLQGKDFEIEEVEPWTEPVSGAEAFDDVRDLFFEYVHADDEALDTLALWTAYSYSFDLFGVCPILDISSPTKRCGKSSTVVVIRYLSPAPLLSGNISPASVYRAISAWKPTLLVDEADTFLKMHDEIRGILNAGHTRDTAFVIRTEGDSNEPRVFSTWAPKVVAAIGRLPDTIEDRSIRIGLKRKPTQVKKKDAFDPDGVRADCGEVRRKLARFALDALEAISLSKPERIAKLNDRAWNNWKPLLQVAEAAGGDWPERAQRAALKLSGEAEESEDSNEDLPTLAFQHVYECLRSVPVGKLATTDVLTLLIERDDGPWAKFWESQVAKAELKGPGSRLARLLSGFGIKPKQLWIDGQNLRGYDIEDFTELALAYLGKDVRDARDARPGSSNQDGSRVPSVPNVSVEGADADAPDPFDGLFGDAK